MEFLNEYESRPRLLIQSKKLPNLPILNPFTRRLIYKPTLFVSLPLSIAIFYIAFHYIDLEPLKSILSWLSCSFFSDLFAPLSLTVVDVDEKVSRKSSKPIRKQPCEDPVRFDGLFDKSTNVNRFGSSLDSNKKVTDSCGSSIEEKFEEREWSSTNEDVLRKLIGKHPMGQPGRWEAIAQGFKIKHNNGSVILKAKEMGLKKASNQDSFGKFLKDRKHVDKRVLDEVEDGGIV